MKSIFANSNVSGVLPYISEFHELVTRRAHGAELSRAEQHELGLLQEMFEPHRIAGRGTHREPLRFEVHRRARIGVDGRLVEVDLTAMTLRSAEVRMPSELAPNPGSHVRVELENAQHDTWYGFIAQVVRVDLVRGLTTVALERPLRPVSIH